MRIAAAAVVMAAVSLSASSALARAIMMDDHRMTLPPGIQIAAAGDNRLSDAQFVKVARCQALPGGEGRKASALFNANRRGRTEKVLDKADDARRGAVAGAKLAQECAPLLA